MPEAFKELTRIYTLLEKHYRDMQDMEFTVEQGKTVDAANRGGKAHRPRRALRIAVELANEGLISKKGRGVADSTPHRSINCCTRPSIPQRRNAM